MVAEPQTHQKEAVIDSEDYLYTAEDLLEISAQDDQRYELIRGKLIVMAPAGFEHGILAMRLGSHMQVHVEEHELGSIAAAETGFVLERNPDTIRAADVAFVRSDRIEAGQLTPRYFPGAPDLAVEVVSPNDTASGVQDKVQDWLTHGTQLVWVVEPKTQTITVFRTDGSAQVLKAGDTLDGEDVLPGFQYPLARLFPQR